MDWFRWYHGTCSDPKLAGIARRLKLQRTAVIAVWGVVLESASGGEPEYRGDLKLDADDIAAALDMKTADVDRVLEQMRTVKLLTGQTVTAWAKRQFKSDDVTARVRSARQRRNGNETFHDRSNVVPETPPERACNAPETETETETEPSPLTGEGARSPKARGSRLASDWTLPQNWIPFALANGFTVEGAITESEKFRDYWHSATGQRATSMDWQKSWQNWIRKAVEYGRKSATGAPLKRTESSDRAAILEGLGLAQGLATPREPAGGADGGPPAVDLGPGEFARAS